MYTSHTKIIREAIFGLRNSSDPVTILHKKRFKIVSVVAKKKSSFCGFSERVCDKDPEVSVWQWWDAEKMNNSVLNIKDEGIAQQLFLFIFHWKHLDSPIHLFICFTPSSVSPSLPFKTCHSSDPFSLQSSVNFFFCWTSLPQSSLNSPFRFFYISFCLVTK